jgi:formylglycine-generating enzyme required for sulfatase activity
MTKKTTKTGKKLERLVADAYRQMGARVTHDVRLAGNQIDVYIEMETPDRGLHRIAVEAKDWARPVGVKIVNDFTQIVSLLRRERLVNEGVIVSTSGFSKEARDAAATHGIRLLEQADLDVMVKRISPTREPFLEPPDVPAALLIPAGCFWMGGPLGDPEADENEQPRREVYLSEYQIGQYPVTNAQYACFIKANPNYPVPYMDEKRAGPYNWDPRARIYPGDKANHPVVLVSWEDAMAYCRWLSRVSGEPCRLPTEEEWEKAARGGLPETRCYPWGDKWQVGCCNTQELGRNGTTSVHEFEQFNSSPFEVVDIAGNVWEWTSSWYKRPLDSLYDRLRYGGPRRVVRGGSWRHSNWYARISCRGRYRPDVQRPYLGFRIASD